MADSSTLKKTGKVRCQWLSSSSWDLDDGPNCEPHSDGKSSSRRTFPILGPRAGGYLWAIVGIDDAGAEQIGHMLTSAFANRLLAAAEEPPTAQ